MDRRTIEAIYPLSPMQRGMVFHTMYAPGAGAYLEQLTCAVEGLLDVRSFVRAWQRVFDRHPVLRTRFLWTDRGEPLQLVRRQLRLPLVQHDWRGVSLADREQRLDALRRADLEQGFDLAGAPLTRLTLIQAEDHFHYLIWSFHHALLDRWSIGLVLREVHELYEAFARGLEPALKPAAPYQDYVRWLLAQDRHRAEAFWRPMLKGFGSPTVLGAATGGDTAARAPRFDRQEIRLPEAVTAALDGFVRAHRLTLNTLVQGAWALVLSRESGREDVVHGATVSTRPAGVPGAADMVGCLLNTLPVRVRVTGEEPVLPWLRRLQAQLLELREYEYSSLIDVQGWSEVSRGQPLFESIVVFENIPVPDAPRVEGGVGLRPIGCNQPRTGYPLTIIGVPGPELTLGIIHDAGRFEAPAAAGLLRRLAVYLEWIAAAPDRPLSALPVIGGEARRVISPLPARAESRSVPLAAREPPRTPTEVTLAGIWAEVLGVEAVSLQDDFFVLGGHSLRAMQVTSRVWRAFGVELPLAAVFEAPTLAGLAQRIEAAPLSSPPSR